MPLKPFQAEDLARAALTDSAIISWEQGLGKTFAAFAWPLVKKSRRTLIIAPASLHLQLQITAAKHFKIFLQPLTSIQDFYRLKLHLPPTQNQSSTRFYISSFQEIGLHGADEHPFNFGPKGTIPNATHRKAARRAFLVKNKIPFTTGDLANLHATIGTKRNGITSVWTPSLARLANQTNAFDCVVIDEGTRLQSSYSRTASSIRLLQPPLRLVLTGTPIKNRLESIFWLASWAAPDRWPYPATDAARETFANSFLQTERFFTRETIKRAKGIKNPNTTQRSNRICQIHKLWKTLAPVIIRRRKIDCGEDIPPKIMNPIIIPPGSAQLAVYRHHLQNPPLFSSAGTPLQRRNQIICQIGMLRLAALCPHAPALATSHNGTKQPLRSWTEFTPKLQATLGLIAKHTTAGKQIIIGSPFREFSTALHEIIQTTGIPCALLDGRTTPHQRAIAAADFKNGKHAVLIAGIKAMGEGHSFENCQHLVLPGLSFAYDENEQFIHRIWRLNSPGPVTIYPLITAGTIDIRLHEIFAEKSAAATVALDGKLLTENAADPDSTFPERILARAIKDFKQATQSPIQEQTILDAWDAKTLPTLKKAANSYRIHHHQITPQQAHDAAKAEEILKIPSHSQASIDIFRKQKKPYKIPTAKTLQTLTNKLKRKNKQ